MLRTGVKPEVRRYNDIDPTGTRREYENRPDSQNKILIHFGSELH